MWLQILEKFINESENGVILLSFGSVSKSNIVDAKLRNVFIETFRCLRQKVIWKFEENLKNISENVLISDWIPQRDILGVFKKSVTKHLFSMNWKSTEYKLNKSRGYQQNKNEVPKNI